MPAPAAHLERLIRGVATAQTYRDQGEAGPDLARRFRGTAGTAGTAGSTGPRTWRPTAWDGER